MSPENSARFTEQLLKHARNVIVVPKAHQLARRLTTLVPDHFILGFSVPTVYGATAIAPAYFEDRPVHLLGGRPDVQVAYARQLNAVSIDCNRFTLDAAYGDYFDGQRFRPHPAGGYETCIRESLRNINRLWRKHNSESA